MKYEESLPLFFIHELSLFMPSPEKKITCTQGQWHNQNDIYFGLHNVEKKIT